MNTIDDLINVSLNYETDLEKVKYILSYFYKILEYNYAYLFAAYMQEDIDGVMEQVGSIIKDGKEYKKFEGIFHGKSTILDKLIKNYRNEGKLNNIVENILRSHIDNEEIVIKEANAFCNMIDHDIKSKRDCSDYIKILMANGKREEALLLLDYCQKQNSLEIARDITHVLLEYIGDSAIHEKMPPNIENGILRKGVCRDYADYFTNLLNEIGIEACRINGTSELEHAWVAAKIDGEWKSIDVVRAIFIRDGYKGIPSNQKASDWLINDFDTCFKMQPTRKIKSIVKNGETIKLPTELSIDNFDLAYLTNALESTKSKK